MSDGWNSPDAPGAAGVFGTDRAVDLYSRRMQDPKLFPQEREAIDRYFTPGSTVLDVGCGAGRVSAILNDEGFDVTGIDVSEPLVDKARSLCPEVDFQVGSITDPDFAPETFDYIVFSWFGIDYLSPKAERIRAFREMYRLLNPAGMLLFSTHNSWHPLVPVSVRNLGEGIKDIFDLYLRSENRSRIGSRYKIERVPLGDVEIYLGNPIHHWCQLRRCGFTPIDIVGRHDGPLRLFERDPHFVAKK